MGGDRSIVKYLFRNFRCIGSNNVQFLNRSKMRLNNSLKPERKLIMNSLFNMKSLFNANKHQKIIKAIHTS